MKRLPTVTLLALLLTSCGEKKEPGSRNAPESAVAPRHSATRQPRGADDERDPRGTLRDAYERAGGETDPAIRERALESVAWDALDVDPELAREAFAELTPDRESSRQMVGHFAMRLAEDDPDQAIEWARALEQEEERSDAFGRIAVVVAAADPSRAADLLSEEMRAGLPRDRAVVQVVQRWAQSAPADAAAWVVAFPQGAARSAGFKAVAAAWIGSDPAALAAWVEAREDGPLRIEAVLAVAEALRAAPPETRAVRLGTFQDPEVRKELESILSQSPP